MSDYRRCEDGGLLVFARGRVPDDRCEYYLAAVQAACGCSRVRCQHCQALVRTGPPGLGLKVDAVVAAAALYAAEDWTALEATKASPDSRLYACRCEVWECVRAAESIDRENDSATAPHMPWACAGHVPPELPTQLGTLAIGPESDWAEVVTQVLGGQAPRALAPVVQQDGPSIWLGWLYAYLELLPEAAALSQAIAARCDDPDPLVRGSVIYFFMRFPKAPGVDRLLALAAAKPEAIAVGYPIAEFWGSPTLFDVVRARLEKAKRKRDALDEQAMALLRAAMLMPLGTLSHADLGPTDRVALRREALAKAGEDVTSAASVANIADYGRMLAGERVDVIKNALTSFSGAFDDVDLHQWLADNIVAIDRAAPGRWRLVMDVLAGWYKKPALGHLIVIAGISLIESSAVANAAFREWMDTARARHRWVDDAWVLVLRSALDAREASAAS